LEKEEKNIKKYQFITRCKKKKKKKKIALILSHKTFWLHPCLLRKIECNSHKDFSKVELKSMFLELTFNIIVRMVAGKWYYGYGEHVKDEEEVGQFRELMREFFVNSGGASNPHEFMPMLWWTDYGGLEKRLMGLA
jgi:isoflavone 2'-hydroxylase